MTSELKDSVYQFLLKNTYAPWRKEDIAIHLTYKKDVTVGGYKRELYDAVDKLVQEGLVIRIEVGLPGYGIGYQAATPHQIAEWKKGDHNVT